MIQFEYSLLFLDVPLTVVLTTFDKEAVSALEICYKITIKKVYLMKNK